MGKHVHELFRDAGWAIGLLILGICLISGGVHGVQGVVVADFGKEKEGDGVPREWKLSTKEGTADLAVVRDGSGRALRLRSHSASFAIQKEVDIDLKQTPFLVWQWKVTELPRRGDLRSSGTDDQAAQLFVMVSPDFLRTDVIAYIWDTTAPAGTVAEAPAPTIYPFVRIKMVVLRSGKQEKGKWITETRNVVEDYKKLFGDDPDKVTGIRLQINSQHTKSRAESLWRFLTFKAIP